MGMGATGGAREPGEVGKTSRVTRFARGIFSDKNLATLGVKIDRKRVGYHGREIQLTPWGMAGEDEFAKANASNPRGAGGYLLVIGGTRRLTLER